MQFVQKGLFNKKKERKKVEGRGKWRKWLPQLTMKESLAL